VESRNRRLILPYHLTNADLKFVSQRLGQRNLHYSVQLPEATNIVCARVILYDASIFRLIMGDNAKITVDFGTLIWALPSFWRKMRGGLRIGASPLLISVLVVRCRDQGPPFAYPLLMSRLFFTDALNEIGA